MTESLTENQKVGCVWIIVWCLTTFVLGFVIGTCV